MGKPKKLYYVEVLPGGTALGFREKGGGVYVQRAMAQAQKDRLQARGTRVKVWEIDPVEWKEVIV